MRVAHFQIQMDKIRKRLNYILAALSVIIITACDAFAQIKAEKSAAIDLAGTWQFQTDSLDRGIAEKWYSTKLKEKVKLPGSMTTNGKGNDITVHTPWTGEIVDSSWFSQPQYAKYRRQGNIKIPFWLQPEKYYKGAAWYQKSVTIPASWKGEWSELFIERSHWETTVWVDDVRIGMENSLGTAHVFQLKDLLTPGKHVITVRIDNRVKGFNVGMNSHSITDHTQTNWNGMVGTLQLRVRPKIYVSDLQLYPDIHAGLVRVKLKVNNPTGAKGMAQLNLSAISSRANARRLKTLVKDVVLNGKSIDLSLVYAMGSRPLLWNEFHPDLYRFAVNLKTTLNNLPDQQELLFGMREFKTRGTQFIMNDQLTFLRGTLDCASFPRTGYPPTDLASWLKSFSAIKHYGLNHVRFHSWCPPEAAFAAADQLGIYLQIECSSWASTDAVIGDGRPLDEYIYKESERMVKTYGNHPSFVMMTYGNEPSGKNHVTYLTKFVNFWKVKDTRRLYTTGAGWPVVDQSDYNNTPDPRIQRWGEGLNSILNGRKPSTTYDWSDIISKWKQPSVSHEIGQWCVYPDFKEMKKYTGILKPKNFEIFQDRLKENGMYMLADSFLMASGKLQVLCYKADIEAALRTPDFGGFQLLGLNDFPGQGTALVGVLDPFWEEKNYVTAVEYRRFCNAVVPLVRLPSMIYTTSEQLVAPVEVANFGGKALAGAKVSWTITKTDGTPLYHGEFNPVDIALGNGQHIGTIRQKFSTIQSAEQLLLKVKTGSAENSWDIFVYPTVLPDISKEVRVTQVLDDEAVEELNSGGKVLLTLKKGSVKPEMGGDIKVGFSSIFWNTAWTKSQPPTTLGILCNPEHPAFAAFPTEYHSNWQWWDAVTHSSVVRMDALSKKINPLVRVIDDWVTARPLGLIFECKVGKGSLIVSAIDLLSDRDQRPEARQLLYSLQKYMEGNAFTPEVSMDIADIQKLTSENSL